MEHGYIIFSNNGYYYDTYDRTYVIAESLSKAKYKAYKQLYGSNTSAFGFYMFIMYNIVKCVCLDEYFKNLRKQTIFDYIKEVKQ